MNQEFDENVKSPNKNQNEQEVAQEAEQNAENSDTSDENTDLIIEKLETELNEITDKFYRANADFENIKKRLEREKDSAISYASEKFAKDLLPIIDALEEAAKIDIEGNELADQIEAGVKQCIDLFIKTFEKYGITQISTENGYESESGKFYPIQLVDKEGAATNDIVQILQKGYLYKDRILRPVMVILAK